MISSRSEGDQLGILFLMQSDCQMAASQVEGQLLIDGWWYRQCDHAFTACQELS